MSKIKIKEEAFCEHCGKLEPFTPVVIGNTSYCIDCAEAREDITESMANQARKDSIDKKIKWHEKCIKELEKQLI